MQTLRKPQQANHAARIRSARSFDGARLERSRTGQTSAQDDKVERRRRRRTRDKLQSAGLAGRRLMVVADLFDLAVNYFHHFGAVRFDYFAESLTGAAKDRFGDSVPAVPGTHPQIAAAVGKQVEPGFVIPLHFFPPFKTYPGEIADARFAMKTTHLRFLCMP